MKVVLKQNVDEYSKLVFFGEKNCLFIDKCCAFFLALAPVLQHYRGIVEDAGITVLVLFFPWILLRLVFRSIYGQNLKISDVSIIFGLILFIVYRTFIHGVSIFNLIYNLMMIIYYVCAVTGNINIKYYIKYAGMIASLASYLIIIQYICYYILGFHLQLVPTSLLLPEAEQWILGAKTGLAGITGRIGSLYRPSAFFLEPSHMFLYLFPHIFIVLFSRNINKAKIKMAVLFSVGLLFTTSGMGIVTLAGAWGAYFAMTSGKTNKFNIKNILKPRNFILVLLGCIGIVVMFITVPFVRSSIMRFLDRSEAGAISGRTRLANNLISSLQGKNMILGVTNTLEGIEFNMSGFAATFYKFGVIGIILSYSVYIIGIIKLRRQYFWISLMIVLVSFFSAQTHGTFYMMYYVFILLEGYYSLKYKKI